MVLSCRWRRDEPHAGQAIIARGREIVSHKIIKGPGAGAGERSLGWVFVGLRFLRVA